MIFLIYLILQVQSEIAIDLVRDYSEYYGTLKIGTTSYVTVFDTGAPVTIINCNRVH